MLEIDSFITRLNCKGTLSPVSESTRKDYRNSLEQFQRFLNGRQPTQELVQERLGHATISTTLDLYSHVTPGIQQAAAEGFDKMVLPIRGKEAVKNVY